MTKLINIFVILCASICVNAQKTCGEGEYYVKMYRRRRSGRGGCRPCVSGHWQKESSHTYKFCQPCPSGKFTSSSGSSSCQGGPTCMPGTVGIVGAISENDTHCNECTPGKYSDVYGYGPECQSCPSGKFTSKTKTIVCSGDKTCPAGKYGTMFSVKQEDCYNCPIGKITIKDGLFECSTCPIGQYQPENGKSSCINKEKCSKWKIHQKNAYACVYLYNMNLYIPLVVLYWISSLLALKVWWISMEPCVAFQSALLVTTLGISVWLSTYHPVNLDRGLSDVSFGCLMTFVIFTICGCVNFIMKKKFGKICVNDFDNKRGNTGENPVLQSEINIEMKNIEKEAV